MVSTPRRIHLVAGLSLILGAIAPATSVSVNEDDTNPMPHIPSFALKNGRSIPMLGVGCASGVRYRHVAYAIRKGVRLFDTAQAERWGYHEEEVGRAILDSKIQREEFFIQTKLDPQFLGKEATIEAIQRSLKNLQTDYIDSALIHYPMCYDCQEEPKGNWKQSWTVLENAYKDGLIRNIGVSNFNLGELHELEKKGRMLPHIVQEWMDPFHQSKAIRKWCSERQIHFQAYSQFGTQWLHQRKGAGRVPSLTNEKIKSLAQKHDKSPAQIILNWLNALDVGAIPASTKHSHIQGNIEALAFKLDPQDIQIIESLDGELPGVSKPHDRVKARFTNLSKDTVALLWRSTEKTEELILQGVIKAGDVLEVETYPGHQFVAKPFDGKKIADSIVLAEFDIVIDSELQGFVISDKTAMDEL